jgi:hypothetical protein
MRISVVVTRWWGRVSIILRPFRARGLRPFRARGLRPFGARGLRPFRARVLRPFRARVFRPFRARGLRPFGARLQIFILFIICKRFGLALKGRAILTMAFSHRTETNHLMLALKGRNTLIKWDNRS